MRSPSKVQVAGQLVQGSSEFVEASSQLRFGLVEESTGAKMSVVYEGMKPGNFEEATQIVAIGTYRDGQFAADQLLVKCPSKYQGVDEDVESHT